jgi:hypothetical protein
MSNELVKQAQNTGLAGLVDATAAADALRSEMGVSVGAYFQFSGKTGDYKFNGQVIDYGTVLAFNMPAMKKGRVCWKDSKPVFRETVLVMSRDKVTPIEQCPDFSPYREGEGYADLIEVGVQFLDTGEQAELSLSSRGGVSGLTRLFTEWATKGRQHPGMVPLVEIGANEFKLKDRVGSAFAPTFAIVDWIHPDELAALAGSEEAADEAVEEEPAPPPPPPKAAAPAAKRPLTGLGSGVRGRRTA